MQSEKVVFDYSKLRGIIKEKGFSESMMAKEIGITKETFSKKINNESFFNSNEIVKLVELLKIDDSNIKNVFFTLKCCDF